MSSRPIPPGYLSKAQAAKRLGISIKTLDRRRQTEPTLDAELNKGGQLLFREPVIEAYFRLCKERGYI